MFISTNKYGPSFQMYCFNEPNYIMKITASWILLNGLKGAKKRGILRKQQPESKIFWPTDNCSFLISSICIN